MKQHGLLPTAEQEAFARHLEGAHGKYFPGIGDRYLALCCKPQSPPYSKAAKRAAVLSVLQSEDGCKQSDKEIARQCGVQDAFVKKLRALLRKAQ